MIRKQTKLWTTKEGDRIRLCDLEDSHLLNILNMLRRRASYISDFRTRSFLSLPEPSSDHAQDCYDMELDQLMEEDVEDELPPIFHNLTLECIRRGLDF